MGLLDGIRVVDFTAAAAGPYCSMLLADLGAEVIKVEPPRGDHGRQWGNWHVDGKSFLFFAVNRNKKSVVADLRDENDRRQIHDVIKTADVVIESFAPGGAEKLGVDYATCKGLRDDLLYCSVSGFGRSGPLKNELGMDMMLQAYTGIMSYTGEPDRPPIRIAVSAIDLMTGTMGFGAIMAALYERMSTGEGQYLEVSLYDTAMNLLLWAVPQVSAIGRLPKKLGGEFEHVYPYGNFAASDDYFYLGVSTPAHWKRFCDALGLDDLAEDPRFKTNGSRIDHREELRGILYDVFAEWTVEELGARLKPAGIPFSKIQSVDEAIHDDHARERGVVRPLPGYQNILVAAAPLKMERGLVTEWTDPPDLGSHTDDFLSGDSPSDGS